MSRGSRPTLPGAEHTLFAGYGPFVALIALLLAMALLAPTVAPEREVTTQPRPAAPGQCRTGANDQDLRSSSTDGRRK
jgi:hypothetical protein